MKKVLCFTLVTLGLFASGFNAKVSEAAPHKKSAPATKAVKQEIRLMLDEIYAFTSGKPGVVELSKSLPDNTVKAVPVMLISFNRSVALVKGNDLLLIKNDSGDENSPKIENPTTVYILVTSDGVQASDKLTDEDLKKVLPVLSAKFDAFFNSKKIISTSETRT
jgi:hypothetical protein